MKSILLSMFIFICLINSHAQIPINLPVFKAGKYENVTIHQQFARVGKGTITALSPFISGIEFFMIIDSIDPGTAPAPAGIYKDASGKMVPMYKGTQIKLPAIFEFFGNKLGFSVVMKGTPTVPGESYFCDLATAFTLGEDFGMAVVATTQKKCIVDIAEKIEKTNGAGDLIIYPNPATNEITVNGTTTRYNSPYRITDNLGRVVLKGILNKSSETIDVHHLCNGTYFLKVEDMHLLKFIKN